MLISNHPVTPIGFDYENFLRKWFAAGEQYPGVFILGCYARYVTLFSQQMRALNLIGALVHTKQLQGGTDLAVVGGGVAGLTAAFAAQLCGAKVTLIEKRPVLMSLQRNCSKRWIHPHIYDWPANGSEESFAGLPIFDWHADLAYKVIIEQFEDFRSRFQASEKAIELSVMARDTKLEIEKDSPRPRLEWRSDKGKCDRAFSIVVVAVGFGEERSSDTRRSYWEDDELDSFRARERRWLIVGSGDSALTDLMRLCIQDFRHADLLKLLPRGDLMISMKADLLEIEKQRLKPEELTAAYQALGVKKLIGELESRLRQGNEVCITTEGQGGLYNPRACVLNRFILRLLIELKAVTHIAGYEGLTRRVTNPDVAKFGSRVEVATQYEAKFGSRAEVEVFDKVLERFGPDAAITSFDRLNAVSSSLRNQWEGLPSELDESRQRHWPPGLYGPEAEGYDAVSVEELGVSAKSMTVTKQVLPDGRSYVTLSLDGLTVHRGKLRGVWVRLKSVVGELGQPEPDQWAQQLGAHWESDEQPAISSEASLEERLQFAREKASMNSGVMAFSPPLTPETGPVRLGMSVVMLNSVALSSWEFYQFYDENRRQHIDGSDTNNLEYFARSVWFPVETFVMQLELPPELCKSLTVRRFRYGHTKIRRGDIVSDDVLNLGPRPGAKSPSRWIPDDEAFQNWKLTKERDDSWKLEVKEPEPGTCFSLDWVLPSIVQNETASRIEGQARQVRHKLLLHRWQRMEGNVSGDIHQAFSDFERKVREMCAEGRENESLSISLMTYNESRRRLEVVESALNGGEAPPNSWNFWLPFGLGLAGACFKDPGAFLYVPPPGTDLGAPDYFLKVPGIETNHGSLLALSLDHSAYDSSIKLERSRQCIGVVDISSNLPEAKLIKVARSDQIWTLVDFCREFSDRLSKI